MTNTIATIFETAAYAADWHYKCISRSYSEVIHLIHNNKNTAAYLIKREMKFVQELRNKCDRRAHQMMHNVGITNGLERDKRITVGLRDALRRKRSAKKRV